MNVVELRGSYSEHPSETFLLIKGTLVKVVNFSCLADIERLVSEYFGIERGSVWSENTLKKYKDFLRSKGVKNITGKKKDELRGLILDYFGVSAAQNKEVDRV